jgi:hypothetical protein
LHIACDAPPILKECDFMCFVDSTNYCLFDKRKICFVSRYHIYKRNSSNRHNSGSIGDI